MNFLKSADKGFSLIELLVVMAIIAVLFGLGVNALLRFQATVEIEESGRQMITLLNFLKNNAKNDVRPRETVEVSEFNGFKFDFENNEISACTLDINQDRECDIRSQDLETQLLNLEYDFNVSDEDVTGVIRCESIVFESLTGSVLIIDAEDANGAIVDDICYIPYTDANERETHFILVDGIEDSFRILRSENEVQEAIQ